MTHEYSEPAQIRLKDLIWRAVRHNLKSNAQDKAELERLHPHLLSIYKEEHWEMFQDAVLVKNPKKSFVNCDQCRLEFELVS
jgi:hypothetical protein